MDPAVVDLSRLQFALTALYHFLFVPLTLGLSFMLFIMEAVYVMTKRPIWRTVTKFWATLFNDATVSKYVYKIWFDVSQDACVVSN